MAVHLTRIYTRTGDDGTTGLADFSRVSKTDPRIVAYADCDETNCALGVVMALGTPPRPVADVLARVQNELFDLGADLATPTAGPDGPDEPGGPTASGGRKRARPAALRITQDYVDRLENECDAFNADLPPLDSFVLPGGSPAAALLHQARAVARRAERSAWALRTAQPDRTSSLTTTYLNRLSDLLFILARTTARESEVKWIPGGERSTPVGPAMEQP